MDGLHAAGGVDPRTPIAVDRIEAGDLLRAQIAREIGQNLPGMKKMGADAVPLTAFLLHPTGSGKTRRQRSARHESQRSFSLLKLRAAHLLDPLYASNPI